MMDFEPKIYRLRIGVTGDWKLNDPIAIEWQRGRLVSEVSISIFGFNVMWLMLGPGGR